MINIGSFIDETGRKYGHWTVLHRDETYPSVGRWVCQCDCGTIKTLYGAELRRGRSKSCGCVQKTDLTGQTFGKLTVISRSTTNKTKWLCQCECGEFKEIFEGHLTQGLTKSCGKYSCRPTHFNDLSGQTFGMLTVLQRDKSKKDVYYLCRCECGNIKSVLSQHLKRGSIISCGCFNKSKGEEKIKKLLLKNNYDFQQEYSFDDLRFNNRKPARFDFKIQINDKFYLIEFDGRQHYHSYNSWGGEQGLLIRQKHDQIKNQYCINNNIPLIRIPYTKFKSLKITDLELQHSKYIVVRGWFDELP